MKSNSFFWGIFLLVLGAAFILRNFGFIDFDWSVILRFWPVILIIAGIGMLPIHRMAKMVVGLLIGLGVIAALPFTKPVFDGHWPHITDHSIRIFGHEWNDDYDYDYDDSFEPSDQEYNIPVKTELKTGTIDFSSAVSQLYIGGTDHNTLKFENQRSPIEYKIVTRENDDHINVSFDPKSSNHHYKHSSNEEVKLFLNKKVDWDLDLSIGASECNLELDDLLIRKLQLDGGASDIDLILGKRSDYTEIYVNVAATDLMIKMPVEVGCELHSKSFLIDKTLMGFEDEENGIMRSENYDEAEKKVVIHLSAAVSNLKIERR